MGLENDFWVETMSGCGQSPWHLSPFAQQLLQTKLVLSYMQLKFYMLPCSPLGKPACFNPWWRMAYAKESVLKFLALCLKITREMIPSIASCKRYLFLPFESIAPRSLQRLRSSYDLVLPLYANHSTRRHDRLLPPKTIQSAFCKSAISTREK